MKFVKYVLPLIVFAMFSIPLIVYFATLEDTNVKKNIARNGTSIVAIVDGYSRIEGDEDDPDTYRINYYFEVEGQRYYGSTSATYSYSRKEMIVSRGTIEVKYLKVNGKMRSVEASYDGNGSLLIVGIIFEVVACGGLAAFVVNIVKAAKRGKVKANGQEAVGYFSSMGVGIRVNDVPQYFVSYYWKSPEGQVFNGKTESTLSRNEAQYYANRKTFAIRTIGEESVIVEKPFTHGTLEQNLATPNNSYGQGTQPQQTFINCPYCGCTMAPDEHKCPGCGAPMRK